MAEPTVRDAPRRAPAVEHMGLSRSLRPRPDAATSLLRGLPLG